LPALLQTKYIVYQLEQLSDEPEGWYQQFPEVIQNILENSLEIWDYSTENLKFLQKKDLPAKLLPVGYLEKLETISPTKKDIDVLFYGSLNERRRRILTALSDRGLKVQHLFAVYGTQRDAYIARSKIILNIHFYEARIFEAARIAYLLNNQAFVITEESVDNPYPAVELIQVPYAQLIEECVQRVADYENSQKIAQKNYQQFKANYAMPGLLASVLS
jgi:hypothetical protein